MLKGCTFRKGGARGCQRAADENSVPSQQNESAPPCHGRRFCRRRQNGAPVSVSWKPESTTESTTEPTAEPTIESTTESAVNSKPEFTFDSKSEPTVDVDPQTDSIVEAKVEPVEETQLQQDENLISQSEAKVVETIQPEQVVQQINEVPLAQSNPDPTPVSIAPVEPEVEENLRPHLQTLQAMGFTDVYANLVALRKHSGRVDRVIDELLN